MDGACSLRRAYDLDRGNQAQLPTVRYRKRPDAPAHAGSCASGARYSFDKRLLVVIGEDLDIKRCADSMLPVPADGAGGLRLR